MPYLHISTTIASLATKIRVALYPGISTNLSTKIRRNPYVSTGCIVADYRTIVPDRSRFRKTVPKMAAWQYQTSRSSYRMSIPDIACSSYSILLRNMDRMKVPDSA
eukprot:3132607-Rhodomonas_salina.2